ncbi:MAG TPA: Ig-like domain-containing protein, partial [Rhizomicrobium sp.]|nr:Ig-like domain-containing protein [Rhizomicrobium sp.]
DSDGNGQTVAVINPNASSDHFYGDVGLDTAAGLFFGVSEATNGGAGTTTLEVRNIAGGSIIQTLNLDPTDYEINAVAIDPSRHYIYLGVWGDGTADTGIVRLGYNPANGHIQDPTTHTDISNIFNGNVIDPKYYILSETGGAPVTNVNEFSFDLADNKLYFAAEDQDFENSTPSAFPGYPATNGIYVVDLNAPTLSATLLTTTASQFPTDFSGDRVVSCVLDAAKGIVYFESLNAAHGGTAHLWYVSTAGGAATQVTLPGVVDTGEGIEDGSLALDPISQTLYLGADASSGAGGASRIYKLVLDSNDPNVASASIFASVNSSDPEVSNYGSIFDALPTLSGGTHSLSTTSTDAIQGGSAHTLLASVPTITDPDGAALAKVTVTITNAQAGDVLSASTTGTNITASYDSSSHTLTLSGDDTFADYQTVMATIAYTDGGSDTTVHPTRTLDWTISDGITLADPTASDPNQAVTTLTIDRAPTLATHVGGFVLEGASTGTVGAGDTDPDGDSLMVTAVTGGTVGTAKAGTYGTLTVNSNDTYSYTAGNNSAINAAPTGSHPVDTFTYTVSDGVGGTTTETLNFTIDRAPVLATHTVNVLENASTGTVGAGDTDPDGDSLTVTALSGGTVGMALVGTYGTLTVNSNDTYSYTAGDTSAIDTAPTGSHPVDTFTYTVSDGHGGTSTETLSFSIDRAPVMTTHGVDVVEGASTGTVGAGDTDPDSDTLTVTAISGGTVGTAKAGTYGTLTINSNDTYSYTAGNMSAIDGAATGSHLTDSFTYTVSDGHGGTANETLTFTLDRAPTVIAQNESVAEGGTNTGTGGTAGTGALAGDSDRDGDALQALQVNGTAINDTLSNYAGTYGHLTIGNDGSYSYVADNTSAIDGAPTGSHPIDTFTVAVDDGHGGTTNETLNFSIDRPAVAQADSVTTTESSTATPSTRDTGL